MVSRPCPRKSLCTRDSAPRVDSQFASGHPDNRGYRDDLVRRQPNVRVHRPSTYTPTSEERTRMPSHPQINAAQLSRLVGLAGAPTIIDVRNDEDFAADPRLIPGSIRRDFAKVAAWAGDFAGKEVVVSCQRGAKLSEGVAAWLRNEGIAAANLEGGFEAWLAAGHPLVRIGKLPRRDAKGRTVWVTRARPKIDRIACPWLIRRFVDTDAVILFVQASDTARPDLAPEAAGLLAVSLGLSRNFRDDLEQLDAAMSVYDAFYRWCRDATE